MDKHFAPYSGLQFPQLWVGGIVLFEWLCLSLWESNKYAICHLLGTTTTELTHGVIGSVTETSMSCFSRSSRVDFRRSLSAMHQYLPRWMLDWCVLWVDSYVVLSFQATNSFLKHLRVLFNQFCLCDRLFSSAYCIYAGAPSIIGLFI